MGGAERGTIELAAYLNKKNVGSFVVSAGGNLVPLLIKQGTVHQSIPVDSKNPLVIFLNIFRLRKFIRTHNIDLVDVRSRAPAWSTYFAIRKTKAKMIATFHGLYSHQNFLKKFYNKIMTKGSLIVAVSHFISAHIKEIYKIHPKKIVLIPRGVDLTIFAPDKVPQRRLEALIQNLQIPEDQFVIFVPGRLSRPKGHEVLLEALSYLKNKEYICLFVGKSKNESYRKELEEQAEIYGIRDKLFIKENCLDMPALYKLATVTVSPSTWPESFGRTMAEAGAMGCPVIASNQGGVKEIVIHGETGYLFPTEDTRVLAEYIDKILGLTKAERESMGRKSIEHIQKKFSNKQMFDKTLQAYKNALA